MTEYKDHNERAAARVRAVIKLQAQARRSGRLDVTLSCPICERDVHARVSSGGRTSTGRCTTEGCIEW